MRWFRRRARRPPLCILEVLLHRRHWGLSRWRLVRLPPLRGRAASDQGPRHHTSLTGSSLHGGSQWRKPANNVRQLLLHLVRRLRASLALTDSGVALLTEQARGGARQV